MLLNRTADGRQIANPEKFPAGFAAVADFIHGLGLKSGLYTAKGPTTCAGFAASCRHEAQDAAQWAEWGIDYVRSLAAASLPATPPLTPRTPNPTRAPQPPGQGRRASFRAARCAPQMQP